MNQFNCQQQIHYLGVSFLLLIALKILSAHEVTILKFSVPVLPCNHLHQAQQLLFLLLSDDESLC